MQRVSVPRFDELLVPAIVAIKARGGEIAVPKLTEWVADYLQVTNELRARPALDGSGSDFDYQLNLACTYLQAYGAIMRKAEDGWELTERGARTGVSDVPAIRRLVRDDWREIAATRHFEPPAPPPAKVQTWMDVLTEQLLTMSPEGFEKLCLRVLRAKGFRDIEIDSRSADGGFAGFGKRVEKGQSRKTLVQSKRWKTSVGSGVVRDMQRILNGRGDGGIILTTAEALTEARKEAERAEPKIEIIDRDQLCQLVADLKLGVIVRSADDISVDVNFFQAF